MSRPRNDTIRRVIEHLESMGLSVYGPYIDLDTGEALGSNMDFDADAVLKLQALRDKFPNLAIPWIDNEE